MSVEKDLAPGEARVVTRDDGRTEYVQRGGGDPVEMYRRRMAAMKYLDESPTYHLYRECECGDVYAAPTLEEAKAAWREDTGQDPEEDTDWQRLDDSEPLAMAEDTGTVTKTAGEWAAEYAQGRGGPGWLGGEEG